MAKIIKEVNVNEFEDFTAITAKWFIMENHEVIAYHEKTRFFTKSGDAWTSYYHRDCKNGSFLKFNIERW